MNHALQNEEPVELWHVELAPNDVRVVTLEQLDDAFQRGLVNERTRVFQEGMDEPALLGELLGLGEDEDEAQAEAPASAVTSRHHQETLVGLQAATPHYAPPPRSPPPQAAPKRSAPPPAASAWPPVVQATPAQRPAPVAQQAVSTVSRRPPPPPADSAWPPVVAARPSAAPQYAVAPSVVPTALDLSDDWHFPQPKRRGKAVFFGATVLAVAAGVALTVTGKGTALLSSMTASAASPAPVVKAAAPIAPAKSHAYDPGNEPVKLKEAPPPLVITTCENEASLPAATAPAATAAAVSKSAPSKAAPTRSAGGSKRAKGGGGAPKSGGFKAGSGKSSIYDPLNGSL